MNISSIISQRYMARSVTQMHKSVNNADKPNTFEEKLQNFRKENSFKKVAVTPIQQPEVVEDDKDDWQKVACSDLLFSAWDSDLPASKALAKLDENLSKIEEYSMDSKLDPREVLEHIAAQHALYKKHIKGTGELELLNVLDELVERHTEKYANSFADVVGAFYEENGMAGERDHLYNSVMESVKNLARSYEDFIDWPENKFDTMMDDAHQNKKSLTNELRKAVRASGISCEGSSFENYSSLELSKAAKVVKYSQLMPTAGTPEMKSEEELGVALGKLALDALSFLDTTTAVDAHKSALMRFVRKKADEHLDAVDKLLADATALEKEAGIVDSKSYSPLDRNAVYAVIEVMTENYEKTKSVASASEAGKDYGLQKFLAKADSGGDLERYRDSAFWKTTLQEKLSPSKSGPGQYRWAQALLESRVGFWFSVTA